MQDVRWKQRFANFERAFSNFIIVLNGLKENQDNLIYKMATVQAYEMVFELSWKTLKDFLKEKRVQVEFPRDVIKESFAYEIIEDGEIWIKMLDDRNATVHTYDEQKANEVVNDIKNKYYPAIEQVYNYFKKEL
ncbi:MAG TPA: HI0074 family nucleotidyltransferase substrate-binding subunit [Candidatus Gastranaerophilales bacterium]|nr:HI0074 family nucleotidyltransferase substrate-binding subunit [Candidatus Gastranaerophilales bacterium]